MKHRKIGNGPRDEASFEPVIVLMLSPEIPVVLLANMHCIISNNDRLL